MFGEWITEEILYQLEKAAWRGSSEANLSARWLILKRNFLSL